MASIGSFATSLPTGLVTPQTIVNTTIAAANVEQSTSLTSGVKKFSFINRSNFDVKLSYISTESGSNYMTIPPYGGCIEENGIDPSASITLYYQAATTGGRIEVVSWT